MDDLSVDGSMSRRWHRGDAAARCWAVACKVALGVSLALACQSALAQAMYRFKSIGLLDGCTTYLPAIAAFNNADQVTGTACNANGDSHAFLWKNDGTPMVDLGPDEVGSTSYPIGINASGQVVGMASDSTGNFAFVTSSDGTSMTRIYDELGGTQITATALNSLGQVTGNASLAGDSVVHAFLWKNDGSPMTDLGSLGTYSYGNAINAAGQVVGRSKPLKGPGALNYRAFIWKNNGTPMLELGPSGAKLSEAYAINSSGQSVGQSEKYVSGPAQIHATLWTIDGTPRDLGTLGGLDSGAVAINDSGQVVGGSSVLGSENGHAFVWLNNGSPMVDVGTLGGTFSEAPGINASGQVTGESSLPGDAADHAFLWRNDGTPIQDLNALIDPTDPLQPYVTLTDSILINDFGDIVAGGADSRTGMGAWYLLQGTVLTLAPRALAFGNQPIGKSSAAKSVTVTNTSPRDVAITSITLTGTAAGQFTSTNTCGKSMAAHATCTIKVTFKPTTKGAKSESLNVNGGGGGLRVVALTGTGT